MNRKKTFEIFFLLIYLFLIYLPSKFITTEIHQVQSLDYTLEYNILFKTGILVKFNLKNYDHKQKLLFTGIIFVLSLREKKLFFGK